LCILGRQPELGIAELESLYGAENLRPLNGAALVDVDVNDIDFRRLGGTMKLARVLMSLPTKDWRSLAKYLEEQIPAHLKHLDDGKFTLGLSVYDIAVSANEINKLALSIKRAAKADGRAMRVVPNKAPELNSAQVLHNKLTSLGAWEILAIADEQQTIIAQTMFVQDIEAYAARDQARPKRDARVGMLPPKLAQTIINLSTGKIESTVNSQQSTVKGLKTNDSQLKTTSATRLLDPFCGTGVILQEALLMGFEAIGTDLEQRLVDCSRENIDWLKDRVGYKGALRSLEAGDATDYKWSGHFDTIASEVYLGRAFSAPPKPEIFKQNVADVNLIIKKFLQNLRTQTESSFRLCLALPAWKQTGQTIHLPLLDNLTDMGYNRVALEHVSFDELIYARPGQFVARELVILERL